MHAATTASRSTSNATRSAGQAPSGGASARARDPKQGLRGLDFDEQEQKLRPDDAGAGAAQKGGSAGAGRRQPAPATFDVAHTYDDGEYQGVARYGAQFVGNECLLTVRCKLEHGADVTDGYLEDLQEKAQSEVTRIWDNKFTITDKQTHQAYKLRVALVFTADRPHITVNVAMSGGRNAREDEGHWFIETAYQDDTTFAHEIGHALGLGDEYVDERSAHRKNANDTGVFHDDSIMANANSDTAHAMLRHGSQIAGDIGAASHRQFDAALTPPAAPTAAAAGPAAAPQARGRH